MKNSDSQYLNYDAFIHGDKNVLNLIDKKITDPIG